MVYSIFGCSNCHKIVFTSSDKYICKFCRKRLNVRTHRILGTTEYENNAHVFCNKANNPSDELYSKVRAKLGVRV